MRFILIGSCILCLTISFLFGLPGVNCNVGGIVQNDWEPLRALFEQNFQNNVDLGASLAVYHRGKLVVNLWGGWFDKQKTKPYDNDTLQLVFSTSKGLVAMAIALCVQRGLLNYTDKVIKYWPEYGQSDKENTTVADIMSHRAGLPALRNSNLSTHEYLDWYSVIHKLEKQKPYWVPGTQHGYHAYTYGWLAGELVRRVDIKKRTLGQFIRDEIAKPTQSEFYIGLPENNENRVSPIVTKVIEKQMFNVTTNSLFQQTLLPFSELDGFNDPIVHQAEIPAANGITNARSIARIYASLIGDLDVSKRLLNAEILKQATKSNTPENEPDQVLMQISTIFGMGFMTYGSVFNIIGPGTFGHNGMTVRTALNRFVSHYDQAKSDILSSTDAYCGSTISHASGNGSLMRLAPVPLLYHPAPLNAMHEAINSFKTTHASQQCLDSCRELLNSDQLYVPAGLSHDYWTTTTTISLLEPPVLAVMTGSYKHHNPHEIRASGFVIETMEAALWAFYHTNSFEESALKAVNLGNDADTVGSVYGMLPGAYYGINAIPIEWREKCSFQGLVQTIADEILTQPQQLAETGEKKVAPSNQTSLLYRSVLKVYNELAAFYSGTIKRRVLPCPKQYKSSQ
ncbi:unnamed protein product [Rotaria magnacalcarata]